MNNSIEDRFRFQQGCNHHSAKPLQIRCLYGALVVPGGPTGGGVIHEGRYLQEAMTHRGWYSEDKLKIPEDVVDDDCDVMYMGDFYSCWGHCITDGLKHAWAFLPDEIGRLGHRDIKLVYTVNWPGQQLYENFICLWELLGVRRAQMIRIVRPTRFARVYLPDESYFLETEHCIRYFTDEYKKTIDYIRSCAVKESPCADRRVYFTRSAWRTCKPDFGEDKIKDAILKNNFECVSPETLTTVELIRLMASCSCLVSTEGSAAHNSVFMQDGSELVILQKADYVNGYQFPISQMRKLNVKHIRSHCSFLLEYPDEPWRGPFYLCVTSALAEYLGVQTSYSISEFLRYIIYALRRKMIRKLSWVYHLVFCLG